jgi:hypothetical protein
MDGSEKLALLITGAAVGSVLAVGIQALLTVVVIDASLRGSARLSPEPRPLSS